MTPNLKQRAQRFLRWIFLAGWLLASTGTLAHEVYWSISDENGHAGYLLGTIHSEDPRVLEFTPEFLQQLKACDRFAMELVPDAATLQALAELTQLPGSRNLRQLLGTPRFNAVLKALAPHGVERAQAMRLKPWAAMMTLSLPPPETGLFLDFALSLRAAGAGATVHSLETLDQQLAFLEELSLPQQLELLDQALAEAEAVGPVHRAMVDTYLNEDLATLLRVSREQMASLSPALRDWFQQQGIDLRNQRMAQSARELMDQGCTFIAVGALHLPGPQGLLALLRGQGFELQQLASPFVAVREP